MRQPRPMTRKTRVIAPQPQLIAEIIKDAFISYCAEFEEITRRNKQHFQQRAWHAFHDDAEARLELHKNYVMKAMEEIVRRLDGKTMDTDFWVRVKDLYTAMIRERDDYDIASSFFNSVSIRVLDTTGIDPDLQYVGPEFSDPTPAAGELVYRTYWKTDTTEDLLRWILDDCGFAAPFRNLDADIALAAHRIDKNIHDVDHEQQIEKVEVAKAIFYRGKGAYIVGRICASSYIPLALALLNGDDGIYIDAVLLTEDEVSIMFSFARSYFHVEVARPNALVHFLKSIMPLKPVAELYISLGYNKHGKTQLYRDLVHHMQLSTDKFKPARGERGMVMIVFTLPSYDVVFKVIKDSFDYPKQTTRQEVRNHYNLVFKHDRGGRLVDAQEFEHLRFEKHRFSPELLDELLAVAGRTVAVDGDYVVVNHLYTERRLAPLNLYIREVEDNAAVEAVIDFGQAIKDLAYTNIFPGDILLKNFGVTRHGRVVFYDYDELCLLTDCNFRKMPEPSNVFEELSAEPWYSVGEQDVFPEELRTFMGLPPPIERGLYQASRRAFWC